MSRKPPRRARPRARARDADVAAPNADAHARAFAALPRDVMIEIVSRLSLRDRTTLLASSRALASVVCAHWRDALRDWTRGARCAFVDDDESIACANALVVGAFVRALMGLTRMTTDGESRCAAFYASAFYDGCQSIGGRSTHANAVATARMLADVTSSWDACKRGKTLAMYLKEDIDSLGTFGRYEREERMRAETNVFFAIHLTLGRADLSHLSVNSADDGRRALDALQSWKTFAVGFSALLREREQTSPTLFAVLTGPCFAQFFLEFGGIDEADYDAFFPSLEHEVEFYRLHSHSGSTFNELESLRHVGLGNAAMMEHVDPPWDAFNFNIAALAKMLAFTYQDSSLDMKQFAQLVRDCTRRWSACFLLALLASLVDENQRFAFLISHALFRDVFALSDDPADENGLLGDAIQRGHDVLHMLSRRHYIHLKPETCAAVVNELERCWTSEERECISKAIILHCGIHDYFYAPKCSRACCTGSDLCENVMWFLKHALMRAGLFHPNEIDPNAPMRLLTKTLRRSQFKHVWISGDGTDSEQEPALSVNEE